MGMEIGVMDVVYGVNNIHVANIVVGNVIIVAIHHHDTSSSSSFPSHQPSGSRVKVDVGQS